MRVSELGICAAPWLSYSLSRYLFCVNVLCGCYRCCCCFFFGGGELDTISLSFGHLEIVRGTGSNFLPPPPPKRPINFTRPDTYPHDCTGRLGQMKTACIFLYLHRTKNTGKVSQLTWFFFLFQKKQVVGHNILGKVCNPTYHSYVAQNVWLLSIYQMKLHCYFHLTVALKVIWQPALPCVQR